MCAPELEPYILFGAYTVLLYSVWDGASSCFGGCILFCFIACGDRLGVAGNLSSGRHDIRRAGRQIVHSFECDQTEAQCRRYRLRAIVYSELFE